MKIPLTGEIGDENRLNPYEVQCLLAQDVDLRDGTVRQRREDEVLLLSNAQTKQVFKIVVTGDGKFYQSSSTYYGFAWENYAFFVGPAQNSWRIEQGTNSVSLSGLSKPRITSIVADYPLWSWGNNQGGSWNPTPLRSTNPKYYFWNFTGSGTTETVVYTFSSYPDWTSYNSLIFYKLELMNGEPTSLVLLINEAQIPVSHYVARYLAGSNLVYLYPEFVIQQVDRSQVTKFGFQFQLKSSTTQKQFRLYDWPTTSDFQSAFGGFVPMGWQVYLATRERDSLDANSPKLRSPASDSFDHVFFFTGNTGKVTVGNVQNGDTVRLYRAIEGEYVEVASGTATGPTITLIDKGTDVGDPPLVGGASLPSGPTAFWGNRVIVAQENSNLLWVSTAREPLTYPDTPLVEETDGFLLKLPEAIKAVTTIDYGNAVLIHGFKNRYLLTGSSFLDWQLRPLPGPLVQVVRDTLGNHTRPYAATAVDGELVASYDGLYLGDQLILKKAWDSGTPVVVLNRSNLIAVAHGKEIWIKFPTVEGWVRWTVNNLANGYVSALEWTGENLLVGFRTLDANIPILLKLEGETSYKPAVWMSGRFALVPPAHLKWLHAYSRGGKFSVLTDNGTVSTEQWDSETLESPKRWQPQPPGNKVSRWVQLKVELNGTTIPHYLSYLDVTFVPPPGGIK